MPRHDFKRRIHEGHIPPAVTPRIFVAAGEYAAAMGVDPFQRLIQGTRDRKLQGLAGYLDPAASGIGLYGVGSLAHRFVSRVALLLEISLTKKENRGRNWCARGFSISVQLIQD